MSQSELQVNFNIYVLTQAGGQFTINAPVLTWARTCTLASHDTLRAQEESHTRVPPAYEQDGPAVVSSKFGRRICL